MRIAFTGSHCTGKTTLLNQIEKYIPQACNYKSVSEVARNIIKRGYPLNAEANEDSYIHYIRDQLIAEKEMQKFDVFISDRTLLDPLAYAMVNKTLPRPYVHDYFIEMMENIWYNEKEKYDFYIYFPIEFPLVLDGVRPSEDKYREDVDKTILFLLNKYNVKYYTMKGTPAEREEFMLDLLHWDQY